MIPFDFEYYKPTSIKEAIDIYEKLYNEKKEPIYYSGGTEIITSARKNLIFTKALIDIKSIKECNVISDDKYKVIIGGALTLTNIENNNLFPLLSKASKGVADLTVRNKVTLGGNICGKIIYKEALLPLLLSDANVIVASKNGLKKVKITSVFSEKLNIYNEEFIVNFEIDKKYCTLPNVSKKITRIGRVNYPLVTIAALKKDKKIRVAFSGIVNFPFRSLEVEEELNNKKISIEKRVKNSISVIPYKITSNIEGSREYKKFVINNTLIDILNELERR